jgi:GntR family transcriptional regulator, transcriptional repressor for pyruvate dehydrogenase complex
MNPSSSTSPGPIRLGLPDQVVGQLLAAVSGGEHPPGSQLPPEAELAARANVSRLTLREAVKVLRDKGVLRVEHGRGTFVNPPDLWSPLDPELLASRSTLDGASGLFAQQLLEARTVVELGVARLAAHRRTEEDVAMMRTTVAGMQAGHDAGDLPGYTAADRAFHEALLIAARNPFLAALFEPIRTQVEQVRVTTACDDTMREKAIAAHTRILEAVAAADAQAATGEMWAHLEETHLAAAEGHRGEAPPAPARPPAPRNEDLS